MTISDLRCDWCGSFLAGPEGAPDGHGRRGVRFTYDPGAPALKDDSGLLCESCWTEAASWLGDPATVAAGVCAVCSAGLEEGRLAVTRPGELLAWLLCRGHAVEFLNRLRTVEPKLDEATFVFPGPPP